jgi:hypothetical protein
MIYRSYLPKMALWLLFFGAFSSCNNQNRELEAKNQKIDSLSLELTQKRQLIDSLQNRTFIAEDKENIPVYFGKEFKDFQDPKKHITEALKQQKDLIPLDPVLGGTMEFRQVQVITENWVLAIYDDGHVQGKSIFEYELKENNKVTFKEVASRLQQ